MKIRQGFVSNSSSSSFMIAYQGGELNKDNILKALKIKDDSPLYGFAQDLSEFVINRSKDKYATKYNNVEKYREEYIYDESDEVYHEKELELLNAGYTIIDTSCSYNEYDCSIEAYLGNSSDFEVVGDGIYLKIKE